MNSSLESLTYTSCQLCPRMCRVDRTQTVGFCQSGTQIRAARAALHHWEEPCISGTRGSGTVFFSGCTLRCCYCQNYSISQEQAGKEVTVRQLSDIFLRLQDQGAHNINLVTATQYLPSVLKALDLARHRLTIPVVYNCGGYERVETVKLLQDYIDIWLPDLKYYSGELSAKYSQARDYFSVASEAIRQMVLQTGPPVYAEPDSYTGAVQTPDADNAQALAASTSHGSNSAAHASNSSSVHDMNGSVPAILRSGVIIRHMVLPGAREDSIRLLQWMKDNLPQGHYLISLLSQYTPFYRSSEHPEIHRRITSYEYDQVVNAALDLGLTMGFMQKKSSAREEYTPPFDLEGLDE